MALCHAAGTIGSGTLLYQLSYGLARATPAGIEPAARVVPPAFPAARRGDQRDETFQLPAGEGFEPSWPCLPARPSHVVPPAFAAFELKVPFLSARRREDEFVCETPSDSRCSSARIPRDARSAQHWGRGDEIDETLRLAPGKELNLLAATLSGLGLPM